MAANSPRNRKPSGSAPLPISALPLPVENAAPAEGTAESALPINSTGELTPAQRARLGLDIYGDQPAPAPTPISNGNGSAEQQPESPEPTEFGFTVMDPMDAPAAPEPKLAPVKAAPGPKLAPAGPDLHQRNRRAVDQSHAADAG